MWETLFSSATSETLTLSTTVNIIFFFFLFGFFISFFYLKTGVRNGFSLVFP